MRAFFAALLIALAALLTPVATVAVWAHDEIGDTRRYVDVMQPLASDPAVQAAVTDRVTKAVIQCIHVDAVLDSVAPADRPGLRRALGPLNQPVASGLTKIVHRAVGSLVAGPAFSPVWTELNRTVHTSVVRALTSGKGNKVTVDLAPVVNSAKQRLDDHGMTVASKIPEMHTRVTLLESDAVGLARTDLHLVRPAGAWLPVTTLLLAAGGVLLATRRRRALMTAALALAGGALLLGIGLTVFRSLYLDRLPEIIPQPAATAVFDALVRFLRTTVRVIVVVGVVVALSAWLSGPGRWPVRGTGPLDGWHRGRTEGDGSAYRSRGTPGEPCQDLAELERGDRRTHSSAGVESAHRRGGGGDCRVRPGRHGDPRTARR